MHSPAFKYQLPLTGVSARSFAGYLKGLGILRVLARHGHPDAAVRWDERGVCHLVSLLRANDLEHLLATAYTPSPILSPWNKDGGFGPDGKLQKGALLTIARSTDPRLEIFRRSIAVAEKIKGAHPDPGDGDAAKKRAKAQFVVTLRSSLPDDALDWLDVCWAIRPANAGPDLVPSPLAGAGGTDGRLDFASAYAAAVVAAFQPEPVRRRSTQSARDLIRPALFGDYVDLSLLTGLSPGLYDPGALGGPNGTSGDSAKSLTNPWDMLLTMEGLLVWGGSSVRHLRAVSRARGAFPFTFAPSAGGAGVSVADTEGSAEAWTPLWDHPAVYPEVRQLFREGRSEWNQRPSTGAADAARAVRALGVQRGVAAFVRYAIPTRNGRNRMAVPLGHFPVTAQADRQILALERLDGWLSTLDRALGNRSTWPASLRGPRKRVDDHLMAYCADGGREHLRDLLWALVDIERAAALHVEAFAGSPDVVPLPLPLLHPALLDAFDPSPALRLALAWASQYRTRRPTARTSDSVGETGRTWWEPVSEVHRRFQWSRDGIGYTLRHLRDRDDYPALVLERLLWRAETNDADPDDAEDTGGLSWSASQPVPNLNLLMPLVTSEIEYAQFRQYVELAVLFDYWDSKQFRPIQSTANQHASPLLALFKAVTQPAKLTVHLRQEDGRGGSPTVIRIPPEPQVVRQLLSGDRSQIRQAAGLATRRIFASGLPIPLALAQAEWTLTPLQSRRMAAALSVPVYPQALVDALTALWPKDDAPVASRSERSDSQAQDPAADASASD